MENIIYAHEHVTIDLSGVKNNPDCHLDDKEATIDEFLELRALGVTHIIDQTNRGMGRDVTYMEDVREKTGLSFLYATGYYKEPFLPEECTLLSEQALADIMVKEILVGIDGTGMRANHIGEIGSSRDVITETEQKIFRAAARAQAETGRTICTHTTLGTVAKEQVILFETFDRDLSKIVISHVDLAPELDDILAVLEKGVNVAFDTIGKVNYREESVRVAWLKELIARGFVDQIVMSVDITRKSHFKKADGIGYDYLLTTFVPLLREAGIGESDITAMLSKNPKRIYQI